MTEAAAPRSVRHDMSPWRSIGIFGGLTVVLCAPFWVLINATQTVNAAYIFGFVWMPGVAAILTCRIVGRPLTSLGLGRWNGRVVLIGYLVPIASCLVASPGIWILGFGGFPTTDFVRRTAESFGVGGAPPACCRSRGSAGIWADLGVMALSDHRGGLPRCRTAVLVLVVDVHLCGGRDQLRAGVSAAEVRKPVAADLPAREPQPVDAVDLHPADDRQDYTKWAVAAVAVIFWARRRDVTAPVDNSSAPAH